jgi:hypothetical protein
MRDLSSLPQKRNSTGSNNGRSYSHAVHPRLLLQRAYANPSQLSAKDVLQLQRMIGNRAVRSLLIPPATAPSIQSAENSIIQREGDDEEDDGRKRAKKRKLEVSEDESGNYTVSGRPVFQSAAKKLKVNQDESAGETEDRRHEIHYSSVIAPFCTKAANLYRTKYSESGLKTRIQKFKTDHKMRSRSHDLAMLVTAANSNVNNLWAGPAAMNKAIEQIRTLAERTWDKLAQKHSDWETQGLAAAVKFVANEFAVDNSESTPIKSSMNEVKSMAIPYLQSAANLHDLYERLRIIQHSTEMDLFGQTAKAHTAYILTIWNRMHHALSDDMITGEEMFTILDEFMKTPKA